MSWPTSQDYNEAVQSPASSFSDPSLKSGAAIVNALGLPVPRSGNFADVYQFKGGDGKVWALKCFTRKVAGLQERYAKIDEHIGKANFPFTVGFKYLAEGVRLHGQWYPLLKMEWVEGFTLNEFVRANAGKPQYLQALMEMWARLCGRLRDSNFAHADLQHGNVLLVQGDSQSKLGLKLIDYDGMYVPSLAEYHSGEIGHPNFQHPFRLRDRLYNADADRFPHLVIASALRATMLGGRTLWDRFDNGDNLLFKETDLRLPDNAPIFKTLWELQDDVLCLLLGKLALAAKEPMRKTPWLDDLLLAQGERLTDAEEKKVMSWLGVGPHFTATKAIIAPAKAAVPTPVKLEYSDSEAIDQEEDKRSPARRARTANKRPKRREKKAATNSLLPFLIGGGAAAFVLIAVVIAVLARGGKKSDPSDQQVANNDEETKASPGLVSKKTGATTGKTDDPVRKGPPAATKEPPNAEPKRPDPIVTPPVEPPATTQPAPVFDGNRGLLVGATLKPLEKGRQLTARELTAIINDLQVPAKAHFAAGRLQNTQPDPNRQAEVARLLEKLAVDDKTQLFARGNAAAALRWWGTPESVEPLAAVLTGNNVNGIHYRHPAMWSLAYLGGDKAIAAIASRLTDFFDRGVVVQILQQMGSASEAQALLFLDHKNDGTRQDAARILKVVGTKASTAALLKAAKDDRNPAVRKEAADAAQAVADRQKQ
jgi:hypothetical protein